MSLNKVVVNNNVLLDLTQDTVTRQDVRQGVSFHTKEGNKTTGLNYKSLNPSSITPIEIIDKGLINKVIDEKENITLDLTEDTVTPADVRKGVTFHAKNGEKLEGLVDYITFKDYEIIGDSFYNTSLNSTITITPSTRTIQGELHPVYGDISDGYHIFLNFNLPKNIYSCTISGKIGLSGRGVRYKESSSGLIIANNWGLAIDILNDTEDRTILDMPPGNISPRQNFTDNYNSLTGFGIGIHVFGYRNIDTNVGRVDIANTDWLDSTFSFTISDLSISDTMFYGDQVIVTNKGA